MELLVFGHAGAKVLVFPTREGRFYDYENWGLVNALRRSIEGGCIRLFCVDGIDSESLYCRSAPPSARTERHRQYDADIAEAEENPKPDQPAGFRIHELKQT